MQVHTRARQPRLQLAPHVRACRCDGHVILLDLRRSKYLGVAGPQLACLARAVEGWPASPLAPTVSGPTGSIDAMTRPLVAQGLLTNRLAQTPVPAAIAEAAEPLGAEDAIAAAVVGVRRVVLMLRCATAAALWLRFRSLQGIAESVARRRARLERKNPPQPSPDELRRVVATYVKLRPLVFTAQDRCLHDSLTLVRFLAHEGILARWVIGVRTQPFGAHSWVQRGGIVLNDHPDHVRRYRPILVV